jgi:hypothetical protein
VIDADGCVVAPGFVDIHTHYDAQVFWDRMLTVSPWHGVTSVVIGNCGFGVAPTRPAHRELILRTLENVEGMSMAALEAGLGERWPFETFPEFLAAIEQRGTAINLGAFVGHTPVRLYVMGEEATERAATDDEIAAMTRIVRDALAAGALGFATSVADTSVTVGNRSRPGRDARRDRDARGGSATPGAVMQATIGRALPPGFAAIHRHVGQPVTWTALPTSSVPTVPEPSSPKPALAARRRARRPRVSCRADVRFRWKRRFRSRPALQAGLGGGCRGKANLCRPGFAPRFGSARSRGGVATLGGDDDLRFSVDPSLTERTVARHRRARDSPDRPRVDVALASNLGHASGWR